MDKNVKKIIYYGAGYLIACSFLILMGFVYNKRIIDFIGVMLLGNTFVPVPLDTHVIFSSHFLSPGFIAVFGGVLTGIAVLFEKTYLKMVIKLNKFDKFVIFFSDLKVVKWVERNMFLSIFVSGFSFIPFEPFRLIAVIDNYNNVKYFISTFLGRGLRYYLLAYAGLNFIKYDWLGLLVVLSLFFFFIITFRSYLKRKKRMKLNLGKNEIKI